MLEKSHNKHALICDNCGDGVEEFESYDDLQDYIRQEGWKIREVFCFAY